MKLKLALIVAVLLILASVAARTAKAVPVWEYPYPCWAYQAGIWGNINGQEYICEYVGPYSYTGYAWVPQ